MPHPMRRSPSCETFLDSVSFMRYVVIMAGGSGTRLWPLSRQGTPKQLLEVFDGKSLLRLAYERLVGLLPDSQILTCTNRAYADIVAQQLPELPSANILGEPIGRDSLGAVALSVAILAHRDPDSRVAMVTADQIIEPTEAFQSALNTAFEVVESDADALVTLGVIPTSAHTGYGYLRRAEAIEGFPGVYRVAEFKEKPDLATAQGYLESGDYWWNAGMFVWRATTLLKVLENLEPEVAQTVRTIAQHPEQIDELFGTLKKNSVDYAIMEPVSAGDSQAHIVAVGLMIDWRDVGGYESLAEEFLADEFGNRVQGRTAVVDSNGCLLINAVGQDHVVAGLGLTNMLVVATQQATLVAPLSATQQVKQLVELVRTTHGADFS